MTIPAAERKKLERLAWRYVEAQLNYWTRHGTRHDGGDKDLQRCAEANVGIVRACRRLASRPQKRRGK